MSLRQVANYVRNSFRRRSSQPDLCDLELSCNRAEFPCQDPVEVEKLINDLKAAVEVNSSEGRRVLYPGKSMKFDAMPLEVSLRDDPSIRSTCEEFGGTQLCMSSGAFGNFGSEVETFIEEEEVSIQREQRLQEHRAQELEKKAFWTLWGPYLKLISCLWGTMLVFVVICLVVRLESYAVAVALCLGAGCLWFCASEISWASRWAVFWKTGGVLFAVDAMSHRGYNFQPSRQDKCLVNCFPPCLHVSLFVCLVVMTVMYSTHGFPWAAGLLWLPVLLQLAFRIAFNCHGKIYGAYFAVFERIVGDRQHLATEGALYLTDHTIVFEGKILPNKPCVSSWPGKYESAWNALVQKSRGGNLSAAVVFLPQRSRHFGIHDQIPTAENLPGACWCTPLYGEQKPWGCRWWTHWVQNIEEAVEKGAELEVYFFRNMKGKGKVENFSTAGTEHLRRERIFRRKGEFKKSPEFKSAVTAGLEELSKQKCGDGSSQYSREEHRLFLAWLEEEDREFLVSSEGLGNSQKAEVAWLQRKGYAYTEVEVDISKWVET